MANVLARAWHRAWPYLLAIAVGFLFGSWLTVAIAGWL